MRATDSRRLLLPLLLFLSFAARPSSALSGDSGNRTMPFPDYHIPNCQRLIFWKRVFGEAGIGVRASQCSRLLPRSEVLPMSWVFYFLRMIKETTDFDNNMEFFVQQNNGRYCSMATLRIRRPSYFAADLAGISGIGSIECSRKKMKRSDFLVCGRVVCPPATTTQPPAPPPTSQTRYSTTHPTTAIAVLRAGLFGLPVEDELLFYRILVAALLFLVVLLLIFLIQACMRIGRMKRKLSREECLSNVTIRRVTDDQYSSMAAIGETASLGGPELYGSIARRKELTRERKMWLRERSCGGSMGMPASPEDLNGLLPHQHVHHGSLSAAGPLRTSASSLSQAAHQGPNGSLRRLPSYGPPRPPPGPPSCHLSRQNTVDSLPPRSMPVNGHMPTPEEPQGHMV